MGVNHKICNSAKQEYFEMWTFGEDDRYPALIYGFNNRQFLHIFAIAYLCASCGINYGYAARWSGDPIEIVSDGDEARNELINTTYTDISLPLLDSLCEDNWNFCKEIIQRGLQDGRWSLPVTTALLILLDDAQYRNFRYSTYLRLKDGPKDADELPEEEDRWATMVKSLRTHYAEHWRNLGIEPPPIGWDQTFNWNYSPDL